MSARSRLFLVALCAQLVVGTGGATAIFTGWGWLAWPVIIGGVTGVVAMALAACGRFAT